MLISSGVSWSVRVRIFVSKGEAANISLPLHRTANTAVSIIKVLFFIYLKYHNHGKISTGRQYSDPLFQKNIQPGLTFFIKVW